MKRILCMAAIAAVLSGCGGGGGGDDPEGAANVAGLWNGTTSTGRSVSALTFQDGSLWAIYTDVSGTQIAGAVRGRGTVVGTSINGPAKDFNVEGAGITAGTLTAKVLPRGSISGSATSGASSVSFNGNYDADFDLKPSLGTVAGTFTGSGAAAGGAEGAIVQIDPSGQVSGTSDSGCTYSGKATARTDGNAFDVVVTFGGGNCSNGTGTVSGIAYYDRRQRSLVAAALNSTETNGFLFVGVKP